MPQPNDSELPAHVRIEHLHGDEINLSQQLIDLLVTARRDYDWPYGTGRVSSQRKVQELVEDVERLLGTLSPERAHSIIQKVSLWGGNNEEAQRVIDAATSEQKIAMKVALQKLESSLEPRGGLESLSNLPGIGLVMATKVYRFCYPLKGASLDRHSSYFFNSLDIVNPNGVITKCTRFKREWSNKKHVTSRLAIYNAYYFVRNLNEYLDAYLLMLRKIADKLNGMGQHFTCAATNSRKQWQPADVEMAAYFWWARNGAR